MMTRVDASKPVQDNLFKVMLRDIVSMEHELVLLRNAIDWDRFEKVLAPAYCSDNGRPSIPVRTMVGLTFLKYMFGLSDQKVLDEWCENPYYQYFCGGEFFEHEPPTDQTVMSRRRAGERGVTDMIAETLDRARERIVAVGAKLGISFRRNYVRKGKSMLRRHSCHVRAQQFNRAENVVRALKQYLRNVVEDAETCQVVPAGPAQTVRLAKLAELVELSKRLIAQDRTTPGRDKIYSVHEPQVECIAKGKAHKRYELGVKAGFVSAARTSWVLGAMALPGNPYDGNTLAQMLRQAEEVSGVKPRHAYCDLGYRGHDYGGECDVQVVNRFRKRKPRSILMWWNRRSAIEPVIGHVKSDHRMGRNMLAGAAGDRLNTMLAAVGFNLVKLMRGLKRLFLCLRTEAYGFAAFLAELVWMVLGGGLADLAVLRCRREIANRGFA